LGSKFRPMTNEQLVELTKAIAAVFEGTDMPRIAAVIDTLSRSTADRYVPQNSTAALSQVGG